MPQRVSLLAKPGESAAAATAAVSAYVVSAGVSPETAV